jgi:SAM-dependent methyltransferase
MARGASRYGDVFADVYDDWYHDVSDVAATVDVLAALAGGLPVLELGAGSGRLAIPLAQRGIEVHGLDASRAMLARLAAKPGGDIVHVLVGDMAELPLRREPRFGVVFAAFNTLCNLCTADAQQRCIDGAARLLAPGGRLVLEVVVPAADPQCGRVVEVARASESELVLMVSEVDADTQHVRGHHLQLRDGRVNVRPWELRYVRVDELDRMAEAAGLRLESRHGGWQGEAFDDDAGLHVSAWARQ